MTGKLGTNSSPKLYLGPSKIEKKKTMGVERMKANTIVNNHRLETGSEKRKMLEV